MYKLQVQYIKEVIQQLQKQKQMFGFFWKKPNKQFNLNNSYLTVQFLTQDQKIQKDKIISKLSSEYQNQIDTIVSYASSFRYSYRYTLFSTNIKNKIVLAQVMALMQASTDQEFANFYQTNVQKIKLHMKNNKLVNNEDVIELYNQRDISLYESSEVLEVIYEKRGLFDRMKVKGKKFVKNIPKYVLKVLSNILTAFLKFMGLGSLNSIISTVIPLKMILKWVLNFLMVFFPALAPLIGLSKLVI